MCILYQRRVLLGAHITLSALVRFQTEREHKSIWMWSHASTLFRSSLGWMENFRAEDDSFSLNLRVIRRARSGARPVFQIKRLRLSRSTFDVSHKKRIPFLIHSRGVCIKIYIHRVGLDVCVCVLAKQVCFFFVRPCLLRWVSFEEKLRENLNKRNWKIYMMDGEEKETLLVLWSKSHEFTTWTHNKVWMYNTQETESLKKWPRRVSARV